MASTENSEDEKKRLLNDLYTKKPKYGLENLKKHSEDRYAKNLAAYSAELVPVLLSYERGYFEKLEDVLLRPYHQIPKEHVAPYPITDLERSYFDNYTANPTHPPVTNARVANANENIVEFVNATDKVERAAKLSIDEFAKTHLKFNQVLQKLIERALTDKYAQRILDDLHNPWTNELHLVNLANMLAVENWRAHIEALPENIALMQRLESAGIRRWDDPTYAAYYVSNGQKKTSQDLEEAQDPLAVTSYLVTEFLGKRVDKEFVAGKYMGYLKNPVGKVYADLRQQLIKLVKGDIDREGCIFILSQLKAEHVKEGTLGERALNDALEALSSKTFNFADETIEAGIWKRDPWEDIGYSQEFNCCAFGANTLEDAQKNKVLHYLKYRGISVLQIKSPKEGKICAGILTPVTYQGKIGLLVDSYEGTDRLDFDLAHKILKDYAEECNFSFIAYNRHVHNKVPQKFIAHLETKGLKTNTDFNGEILAEPGAYLEYGGYFGKTVLLEPLSLENKVSATIQVTA